MLIPFVKMQAQGNDFVILDAFTLPHQFVRKLDLPTFAASICRPKTAVGADGLVLVSPSKTADGQMLIYNSDGSRAEMCGSALRCVAWLLMAKKNRSDLSILTDSGIKTALINNSKLVTVNLGRPKILEQNLVVEGFTGDLVDIGNLHFIVWQPDLESDPHLRYGKTLETHSAFPRPVNVHFARLLNESELEIKIWERAAGPTMACGTGAASTVCSALARGATASKLTVIMPGGSVVITPGTQGYLLSGEVGLAFRGEYEWKT